MFAALTIVGVFAFVGVLALASSRAHYRSALQDPHEWALHALSDADLLRVRMRVWAEMQARVGRAAQMRTAADEDVRDLFKGAPPP